MKRSFSLVVAAAVFSILASGQAQAVSITLDGRVNDWGVTPFSDWVPNSSTAVYVNGDNTKGPYVPKPNVRIDEQWDLEAMYFDNDDKNLYFAIVTSSIATKGIDTDLAFDLGADGTFEYGVNFDGYNTLDQTVQRPLMQVSKWDTNHGGEWHLPLQIDRGRQIGTASVTQRYLGEIEPNVKNAGTYIIEGSIDLSLLGIASACKLPLQIVYTRVSCLKDSLVVKGICTGGNCGNTEVPEPATMLLLATSLLGAARMRRRG